MKYGRSFKIVSKYTNASLDEQWVTISTCTVSDTFSGWLCCGLQPPQRLLKGIHDTEHIHPQSYRPGVIGTLPAAVLKYPLFPEGTKFPWLHILIHQWCPAYAGMPAIEPRHCTYSAAHSMSVERCVQFWRQPDILLITDVTPSASFFARNICLDAKGWTHLKIRVFVLHCITKQW